MYPRRDLRLRFTFSGGKYPFSISSYPVSRTLKAKDNTLFEANRSFENGRSFMEMKVSIIF